MRYGARTRSGGRRHPPCTEERGGEGEEEEEKEDETETVHSRRGSAAVR